jgi:predicted aldo/keto reductase-like oxidoreductase
VNFNDSVVLGRTGFKVGRLGVASGYGAPTAAVLDAFERGCNYWTWGTVVKGFSASLREAIKTVTSRGQRDRLVLAMFTYAHHNGLTEHFLRKGLKSAGLDHADVLILGYFSKHPSRKLIEGALELKKQGLVRAIGMSGHNRKLFAELAREGVFDVFHLRYSAAHRGAETETFPFISGETRPGVVSFTATKNGKLLNPKKMPAGEAPATAADCYRFVLSHPAVDVCMMGTKTCEQMRENLKVLDGGPMSAEELARMRRLGDFVHGTRS